MKRVLLLFAVLIVAAKFAAPAHADIKIAVAGPMTEQDAAFGEQFKIGAELAVKDINESGGVLGQQVDMKIYDDGCDPRKAVAVANRLASDAAVFVVGHFCSDSLIPASKIYEEEGIIQISPGSTIRS
jgi:branched-chain amino acid transport system substrate-binding protein